MIGGDTVSAVAALFVYGAATWRLGLDLRRGEGMRRPAPVTLGLLAFAILLHGLSLWLRIPVGTSLNLGVFNTASLVAWFIALVLLLGMLSRPRAGLGLLLLPLAMLSLLLDLLLPAQRLLPEDLPAGMQLHIVFSLAAYGILALAAVQAMVLWLEDRLLRRKRPLAAFRFLPPLQTMEELLFQLIALGFFLLSLGLASGWSYLTDAMAQHLLHKMVLSMIAWVVFAVLLWGRWQRGWRGRIAVRYTLAGFLLLMLGYFGSKVVLELILHRV